MKTGKINLENVEDKLGKWTILSWKISKIGKNIDKTHLENGTNQVDEFLELTRKILKSTWNIGSIN